MCELLSRLWISHKLQFDFYELFFCKEQHRWSSITQYEIKLNRSSSWFLKSSIRKWRHTFVIIPKFYVHTKSLCIYCIAYALQFRKSLPTLGPFVTSLIDDPKKSSKLNQFKFKLNLWSSWFLNSSIRKWRHNIYCYCKIPDHPYRCDVIYGQMNLSMISQIKKDSNHWPPCPF